MAKHMVDHDGSAPIATVELQSDLVTVTVVGTNTHERYPCWLALLPSNSRALPEGRFPAGQAWGEV